MTSDLRYSALYALGRFAEARAALDTEQPVPNVLSRRGVASARAGDTTDARRALAALVSLDTDRPVRRASVALERARVLAALGRLDDAVRALGDARRFGAAVTSWSLTREGFERLRGYAPAEALIASVD